MIRSDFNDSLEENETEHSRRLKHDRTENKHTQSESQTALHAGVWSTGGSAGHPSSGRPLVRSPEFPLMHPSECECVHYCWTCVCVCV